MTHDSVLIILIADPTNRRANSNSLPWFLQRPVVRSVSLLPQPQRSSISVVQQARCVFCLRLHPPRPHIEIHPTADLVCNQIQHGILSLELS